MLGQMSILRGFLRQDFADPFSMPRRSAACYGRLGAPPWEVATPVRAGSLDQARSRHGKSGFKGLFDEVTRPSAFGQTGHRADIWPTLTRSRLREHSRDLPDRATEAWYHSSIA